MSNIAEPSWDFVEKQMDEGRASKRAREVARIIFECGSATTTDLEALGYKHAPRAVRDLREAGVDVEKTMERYEDGITGSKKRRARYSITGVREGRTSRRGISKKIRDRVLSIGECEVCSAPPPLQVDHRVPFEIGGETHPHIVAEFMPLCPSCNRTKSWACEHCPNWVEKDLEICETCMWASPDHYTHVAHRPIRELRGVLTNPEVIARYDAQRPDVSAVVELFLEERDG